VTAQMAEIIGALPQTRKWLESFDA